MNTTIATNIRSGKGEILGEIFNANYNHYDAIVHQDKSRKNRQLRSVDKELPIEEVIEHAKTANAHTFITEQQHQYETTVGRGGGQLSGGQKQRVAIARTLMREPSILLLDEATSALDAESEVLVNQALDNAKKGRTTILIAHRLSTVRSADRIIAIDNGIVVETGTHDELVGKKGYYYNLIKAQL